MRGEVNEMEATGPELAQKVRRSLGEQLELLAKASKRCKPCDLVQLSEAMVLVVQELRNS